jgi:hypothetical protein
MNKRIVTLNVLSLGFLALRLLPTNQFLRTNFAANFSLSAGNVRMVLEDKINVSNVGVNFYYIDEDLNPQPFTLVVGLTDNFYYFDFPKSSSQTVTIKMVTGQGDVTFEPITYESNHLLVVHSVEDPIELERVTAQDFINQLATIDTCLPSTVNGYRAVEALRIVYFDNLSRENYNGELAIFEKSSTPILDYNYEAYLMNDELYDGLEKNSEVLPLDKWNFLETMYSETDQSYPISYSTKLSSVLMNGNPIEEFFPTRINYYQLLPRGTTVSPTITVEKINAMAGVTITYPVSLPGNVTIGVGYEGAVQTYTMYLDVIADNRLMIYYPDTNFERTSGTGLLQEWGYTGNQTFVVSTEQSHSGIQSVKVANEGSAGWMGVGFAETGNIDYPAKGDVLKAGVWVYGLAQGDIVLEIYSKEAQGQIAVKIHTILPQDIGRWVYVETSPSTQVALNADYVQIVIKNYSLGSVYIDDISLFRVEN